MAGQLAQIYKEKIDAKEKELKEQSERIVELEGENLGLKERLIKRGLEPWSFNNNMYYTQDITVSTVAQPVKSFVKLKDRAKGFGGRNENREEV